MKLTSKTLFAFQLLAHLSVGFWLFANPTLNDVLSVLFMYFLTGCLGMTVCYHRLLTHRSFSVSMRIEKVLTMIATLGLTGSSLTWTATHRMHHVHADREGDPHGPSIIGYLMAQWGSMFSHLDIKRSPVLASPFHRWVHQNYLNINVAYGVLLLLVFGPMAVLNWWLVPAALLWNMGSLINTLCHTRWLGYRNGPRAHEADRSVNMPVLGLLVFGEGWHANHHSDQRNPSIGRRWFEIDIGYWIIYLIRRHNK